MCCVLVCSYDASKPHGAIAQFLAGGAVTCVSFGQQRQAHSVPLPSSSGRTTPASSRRGGSDDDALTTAAEKLVMQVGVPVVVGDVTGAVYVLRLVDTEAVAAADRHREASQGSHATLRRVYAAQLALRERVNRASAEEEEDDDESDDEDGAQAADEGGVAPRGREAELQRLRQSAAEAARGGGRRSSTSAAMGYTVVSRKHT